MNFFEHQDRARKNTTKLVVLFGLGILSLIVTVSIVVVLALSMVDPTVANYVYAYGVWAAFEPEMFPIFGGVALGVVGLVGIGALSKTWQLNDGGKSVAQSLGGKLILPNSANFYEKRALNVVEEMAIASGIAVPPVYILDEDGINAFAAGYGLQDAVIGLTRGCITNLSRDELQGVVAHEFSHIFHGDMRLNIRLVSWLYGMILIGMLGRIVVRFSHVGSGRSRGKNSGIPAAIVIGAALMVAGYAGSFFGGLIRAALSRQREYLADASAVQYTRNPQGIAGALKKIGTFSLGTSINTPIASEYSHLFFGDIARMRFGSIMATHPPLQKRILRLDPSWNGEFKLSHEQIDEPQKAPNDPKSGLDGIQTTALLGALAQAGMMYTEHIAQARAILNQIDKTIFEAAHDPFLARVVAYGIIQSKDKAIALKQFELLGDELVKSNEAKKLFEKLYNSKDELIVPLVELLLPTLKTLSFQQKNSFYETLDKIINADGKLSALEWSVRTIITQNLEEKHPLKSHATLLTCKAHAQVVLSVLAYASGENANEVFVKSYATLLVGKPSLLPKDELNFGLLEHALMELARLQPKHKERFVNAMVTCISVDGIIKPREIQLFKAMALVIGLILPPLN